MAHGGQKQSSRRRTVAEPYAWVDIDSQLQSRQTNLKDIPHPAKPQGQGLTDDEVNDVYAAVVKFIREAEAKLKEKNNG